MPYVICADQAGGCIHVAPIMQLSTFKGCHLILYSDFPNYKELIIRRSSLLRTDAIEETHCLIQ